MGNTNSYEEHPTCLLESTGAPNSCLLNDIKQPLINLQATDIDVTQLNPDLYKVIGGTHVISKEIMGQSVRDGNCIAVSFKSKLPHVNEEGIDLSNEDINWICEDDFEHYWEHNCMPIRPLIDQCLDELALAKQHGDPEVLKHVLDKYNDNSMGGRIVKDVSRLGKDFYKFDHLGHLFLGHCIKIDGQEMCPSESVNVDILGKKTLN